MGGQKEEDGNGDGNPDGEDAQRAIVLRMEPAPSRQEIADHTATHVPFMSWCPYCVAGKAGSDLHRKKKDGQDVFQLCPGTTRSWDQDWRRRTPIETPSL